MKEMKRAALFRRMLADYIQISRGTKGNIRETVTLIFVLRPRASFSLARPR